VAGDGVSMYSLCVSPDDSYVIWDQFERALADLMLVEGFR